MRILLASCLLLAGCTNFEPECLAVGEPARIESIGEPVDGRALGHSNLTTVRLRMNDGTIRACVTLTEYSQAYRVGDVVRGPLYDNAWWLPQNGD